VPGAKTIVIAYPQGADDWLGHVRVCLSLYSSGIKPRSVSFCIDSLNLATYRLCQGKAKRQFVPYRTSRLARSHDAGYTAAVHLTQHAAARRVDD
jgi:hypothetical protein